MGGAMIDRYAVVIDGRTRIVEIEDVDGRLRVVVDAQERVIDARRLDGGVWSVLHGMVGRLIQIDGAYPKLTIEVSHPDGEPRLFAAEVSSDNGEPTDASAKGVTSGPFTLRAPIPGRVVKVPVKVGGTVKVGDTLLVLEAMKMENELRAPRPGVVSAIHAAEGTTVETGQDLISVT